MNNILFDAPPIVVSRELACEVGLEKAIVLQTVHENESAPQPESTMEYLYGRLCWWSKHEIEKMVKELCEDGYLALDKDNTSGKVRYTISSSI